MNEYAKKNLWWCACIHTKEFRLLSSHMHEHVQCQNIYMYQPPCLVYTHKWRKCNPDPIPIRQTVRTEDQGMGCEWLAGLVWEGLGSLRMGCKWLAGLVSRVCLYMTWLYGWEGLGCEWLAGLVWEGLGCVGFVYKIVEIMAVNSDNGGGRVLGLLCVERNGVGSNLAVHFDLFFPV